MRDLYNRKIDYMRISVTDRCNFRCRYCMPKGIRLVPMEKILTYEQITEICEAGVSLGITKFKITGGEPLVRRGCPDLVGMIRGIQGVEQITMTTNGMFLAEVLPELMKKGLDAVNISLDTLKPEVFRYITGKDALANVLEGIHAAADSGLKVKVNTVLQQGINDGEWEDLLLLAKDLPVDVRFIEMMPIGYGKGCQEVSNEVLLRKIRQKYPGTAEDPSVHGNGPARYVRIPGFLGAAGFISAMHGQFCASCNRIRLTSQGRLKPCLCYGDTVDLMDVFRVPDREKRGFLLAERIAGAIRMKPEAHCFEHLRGVTEQGDMVQIGG